MKKLENKIALITGGSSGIGFSTAQLFALEGAKVIITGRRQKELDEAIKLIDSPNVIGIQGDVSKSSDLEHLFNEIKRKFGHLNILFANAGLTQLLPFGNISEEHFDEIFNVNAKGLFFTVQNGLPIMQDGGSIILNASIAGFKGMPATSVYAATKAAVRSFARNWIIDLKDRNIRVNAISPGFIETQILGKAGLTQEQVSMLVKKITTQIPMGRTGKPEEIAKAVLFLASSDSSYISGIDLIVDGGMSQTALSLSVMEDVMFSLT